MILEILKNSFQYAFKDKNAFLKLGLLSIFSFLIFLFILVAGYAYRVVEIGLKGMLDVFDPLPLFNDYKKMFIQGLKIIAVVLAYFLIPIIILVELGTDLPIIFTFVDNYVDLSNIIIQLEIVFISLLFIAILFSFPYLMTILAIPHMVKNNSLKYAFKIKDFFKIIKYVGIKEFIYFYIAIIFLNLITTFTHIYHKSIHSDTNKIISSTYSWTYYWNYTNESVVSNCLYSYNLLIYYTNVCNSWK